MRPKTYEGSFSRQFEAFSSRILPTELNQGTPTTTKALNPALIKQATRKQKHNFQKIDLTDVPKTNEVDDVDDVLDEFDNASIDAPTHLTPKRDLLGRMTEMLKKRLASTTSPKSEVKVTNVSSRKKSYAAQPSTSFSSNFKNRNASVTPKESASLNARTPSKKNPVMRVMKHSNITEVVVQTIEDQPEIDR